MSETSPDAPPAISPGQEAVSESKKRRKPVFGGVIHNAAPPSEEELRGPPRVRRQAGGRPAENRYLTMEVGDRIYYQDTTLAAEKRKLAKCQEQNPSLQVALWAAADLDGVVWAYRYPDKAPEATTASDPFADAAD